MKIRAIINRLWQGESKGLATPDPELFELFGITPTHSGVSFSSEQALRVPAVTAAVRAISEAAASLAPLMVQRGPDGVRRAVVDHPAIGFLAGQANDWTSGYDLRRDLLVDALTSDRGGLVFVNRVQGRVAELIRYRPGIVTVDRDQDTDEPSYKRSNTPVDPADMVHLRAPFGKCPITLARESIAVSWLMERHAANLFRRGARPSGALMFPKGMGEESVKRARQAWRETHEAEGDTGRTVVLYDGAEFKPFTFTSVDAQFLEIWKFQTTQIARAFRVPPSMLFDLDRATWSNTEQMGREFLTYCLEPWLQSMEGAFNRALLTEAERAEGFEIRFDRDDLTRADLGARATVINSLVSSRVINPNEGRDWLDLPPYEGGEQFFNPNIQGKPEGKTDAKPE